VLEAGRSSAVQVEPEGPNPHVAQGGDLRIGDRGWKLGHAHEPVAQAAQGVHEVGLVGSLKRGGHHRTAHHPEVGHAGSVVLHRERLGKETLVGIQREPGVDDVEVRVEDP
jgi:hypothetical protein